MNLTNKQYSSYHYLPNNEKEIITVIPRSLLKKDDLYKLNALNELPLFFYLINLLLNKKNHSMESGLFIKIKKSTVRNFIRKKCHSDTIKNLDMIIDEFITKIQSNILGEETITIYQEYDNICVSLTNKFLKKLEKNTVSFNILSITKTRGEKAKKVFIKIHAYDMREKNRYFSLINISNFLSLDWKSKRKETIFKIKRAFLSLQSKGFISNVIYNGETINKLNSFKFIYVLNSLKQVVLK